MTTAQQTMTDEEIIADILSLDEKATPGPWGACRDGECKCSTILDNDGPVAQVTRGDWGDDYPSIRLVGDPLDLKAEAYNEQITYGTVSDDLAKANAQLIARYRTAAVDLARRLQSRNEALRRADEALLAFAPLQGKTWHSFTPEQQAAIAEARARKAGVGEMSDLTKTVVDAVETERRRQYAFNGERYTFSHDDEHTDGSLAAAAACYASPVLLYRKDDYASEIRFVDCWPASWASTYDKRAYSGNVVKPNNCLPYKKRRRQLIVAAALIVAEIERLDRLAFVNREHKP